VYRLNVSHTAKSVATTRQEEDDDDDEGVRLTLARSNNKV